MSPASKDRPSDLSHLLHPLFVNPENTLGYIKIHKCGTNTYAQHLRARLHWPRAWMGGFRTAGEYQPNPNPEKVLVIVRDPVERYVSGMIQVGGSAYSEQVAQNILSHDPLYTKERNQHVWPYTWFLAEWGRFYERMEFVDIKDAADWFVSNGVELPPEGDRHRNINPPDDVQRLRDRIFSDERVLPRIQEYYTHDYDMLDAHGLVYPR